MKGAFGSIPRATESLPHIRTRATTGANLSKMFGQGYFEEARTIIRKCAPRFVDIVPDGRGQLLLRGRRRRLGHALQGGTDLSRPLQGAPDRGFQGGLVITACHNCRDQIMKSLRREYDLKVDVKYIWELVADSLVLPGKSPMPLFTRGRGAGHEFGSIDG